MNVTVLIAAYNAERFLKRAVESALHQTTPVCEILVVDDASTDATVREVERLAAADSRVRLLRLENNSGPAAARNRGLAAARGDWIAILDADDAFTPDRLSFMVTAALEHEADIVVDSFSYYRPATGAIGAPVIRERGAVEIVSLSDYVDRARPFTDDTDWGLLKPVFRKSFLERTGIRYPEFSRHGEDFLLMVEALASGARLALVPRAGYLYTGREAGLSRTVVDYAASCGHTEQLLSDARFANEPAIREALRRRIQALRRYAAFCELVNFRRQRSYRPIVRRLLIDSMFRSVALRELLRRLHLA